MYAPRIAPAQSSVVGRAAAAQIDNAPSIAEGRGMCVRMVSPRYPSDVSAGAQQVVLRVVIDKNGQVRPLYRISGPRDFELEAMNAVRLWQYRPMMRDQGPIAVATNVEVKFVPGAPAGFVTHPSR
jgi:TonB family protein